ncbi:MAG: Fic family protein [Ruthenibacterium sp.]
MVADNYTPPYSMTDTMMNLVAEISEKIGAVSVWQHMNATPQLRKTNQIRSIHASLAIENNSLSLSQMTDVINGKHILGAPADIREVKNAYEAYERLLSFDPYSVDDLLCAHAILMADLVKESGLFRSGGVGVFNGDKLIHMAPPANIIAENIANLLYWAKTTKAHPLVKSCVFHYEFEFIHPFADGNGRMGRMWNTLLLYQWNPIFAWIPVETVVQKRQQTYYDALGKSGQTADATPFVEFMLQAIHDTLCEIEKDQIPNQNISPQMRLFLEKLGNESLAANEIMHRMGLKNRPAFRKTYLAPALKNAFIEMTLPNKPSSKNQKYRRR